MKNNDTSESQNKIFLEETEFFVWASKQLSVLDELIIVSHTPIVFFKEEAIGPAKEYLNSLENRFKSENLKTTYYMSYSELNSNISYGRSIPERISSMTEWGNTWSAQKNVQPLVVKDGYFPSVSLLIGKKGNKTAYTLMKINFGKKSKVNPIWLGIMGEIPEFEYVLTKMKENSTSFFDYLEESRDALENLQMP